MCGFTTKLELFSKIRFSLPAGRQASAPLPPANFEEICVPKQKNFPFI